MGSAARRLSRRQQKAVGRTREGLCSRCGKTLGEHTPFPELKCEDGGSYGWAFNRSGLKNLIAQLEEAERYGQRRKELSTDAAAVLELIVELSRVEYSSPASLLVDTARQAAGGAVASLGDPVSVPTLAARLGWTHDRVKLAAIELEEQGCIQPNGRGALS